jgi:pimeloyl-ACP methyl ester carboxylesterase
MAGDADEIVNVDRQSRRLHGGIPGNRLDVLAGAGHMIHHVDPARSLKAIHLIGTSGITSGEYGGRKRYLGHPCL